MYHSILARTHYSDSISVARAERSKPIPIQLWHDRLGHPGQTLLFRMSRAIPSLPLSTDLEECGDLFVRHAFFTNHVISRICGPLSPPSGGFHYFMIVKDSATRYSHVYLLTSKNQVIPKLLTTLIQLRAHFPDRPTK